MSNELVKIEAGTITSSIKRSDNNFAEVASASEFFAPVRLMQSGSEQVKTGVCNQGEFYIFTNPEKPLALGKSFGCLILEWRPRALMIDGGTIQLASYDPESANFKKIKEKANNKDKEGPACIYGVEYLVYSPDFKVFATFFLNTPTLRKIAKEVKELLRHAGTFTSKFIKTTRYSWFGADVSECGTEFELPTQESLVKEITKFLNPPEETAAEVAEDDASGRER